MNDAQALDLVAALSTPFDVVLRCRRCQGDVLTVPADLIVQTASAGVEAANTLSTQLTAKVATHITSCPGPSTEKTNRA